MVYTSQSSQRKLLGASVKLDHEYTSTAVMMPIHLPMNCPIILQSNKTHTQLRQETPVQFKQATKLTQDLYNGLSEQTKAALTRDSLANKLRQNWQAKAQYEAKPKTVNLDDSLTSLGWLHGMNLVKVASPTPPPSPTPDTEVNPNSILTVVNNIQPQNKTIYTANTTPVDRIDYRSNGYVKPPYSYATLICMAIKETGVEKITLSAIYQWITENFMYYRLADPSWQNSIRHNLSLNKCFQKVPRRKDEPGKGGFWRINPEYNDMLVDGVLKKKRNAVSAYYPPVKRVKTETEDPWGSDRPEPNVPQVQQERTFVINEGVSLDDLRNGNYSWNQLLNQDIMVGGVTIKTEDIIDDNVTVTCLEEEQHYPASQQIEEAFTTPDNSIVEMTPPSSGNSNSDNSLDEIFDFAGDYQNSPLDMSSTGLALDLTLQGIGVKAPEWWEAPSLTETRLDGMHTPVHSSDSLDEWKPSRLSVEEAIEAFDIDNLFDTTT